MAGFKTRARAVDMLGRQQIAGIPTAISELFKNAYDAYADNVIIDYLRKDNLIVLRDDGIGMTKDDFENKWLTLGTESKVDSNRTSIFTLNKPGRPLMGEKGIGRLAIGLLGSQVLIITRAIRQDGVHDFVVGFINWKLFEIPGLNLDDIYIPVRTFQYFPTHQDLQEIMSDAQTHISLLTKKIKHSLLDEIYDDINRFKQIDLVRKEVKLEQPCKLDNDNHGTRFYISPVNKQIDMDLEVNASDINDAPELIKMLVGFIDSLPGSQELHIKTEFRDHKHTEFYNEVISESKFINQYEFINGDQLFIGKFDSSGNFRGNVKNYGKDHEDEYIVPWRKNNAFTTCGPFEFILMTIQGTPSESNLDKETHAMLSDRLYKYGGMYVYKDGIRILPYGNNRYDFLDIELRRSKHAGNSYYSYRRLIGAIRLTRENNSNLKEKSGREGFQENAAYREMRDILMNFFVQSAKDFFQETGIYSNYYNLVKAENTRLAKLLANSQKKAIVKKNNFITNLTKLNMQLDDSIPQIECKKLLEELNTQLSLTNNLDPEKMAYSIQQIENKALLKLSQLKDSYTLVKPRGLKLNKKIELDYEYYKNNIHNLNHGLFQDVNKEIWEIISRASHNAQLELDRRKRIQDSLDNLFTSTKKTINLDVKATNNILDDVENKVRSSTQTVVRTIENTIREADVAFSSTDFSNMNESDLADWRINIENKVISVMQQEQKELETIKLLLDNVTWEKDESGNIISSLDIAEANDLKMNELTEQADLDSDLAQLGMAVHVINHEFDASIRTVRDNLRRLKAWADVNAGLVNIYSGIKHSFDHLDSYLTLFTPLNRRLQRKSTIIKGHEIESFIYKLFSERFNRHNIKLTSSKAFRQFDLNTYPSSIYPVFVNVIDNATYWIKGKSDNGIINLDIDNFGMVISNNGPEIPVSEWEIIFDNGFTRKPGGRGLGLSISNSVLKEQGMFLEVIKPKNGFNVSFRVNLYSKEV